MKDQLTVSRNFKISMAILIVIGAGSLLAGFMTDHKETWANYLLVNYYFLSLALGAAFFLVLQSISQSGWSSAFKRVPEAMMAYIPFAGLFFLILCFGISDLYHWSHREVVNLEPVVRHRSGFLNVPFFVVRIILYFLLWTGCTMKIRKLSLEEDRINPSDETGIMALFSKSELWSKIFIFILAITFSLSAIDWILSLDIKWYSTIFALKNLIAAFYHGVSVMVLIVFILYKKGYFPFLNEYHLHDFARYLFMLSIVWGYFWFSQFMLIWYGNIPDETIYYYTRWTNGWKILFFTEIGLNWFIPFMVLLPIKTSRNLTVITGVILVLITGQYVDLFVQVIPATTGVFRFTWLSAGIFLGFAGLFALVVATVLGRSKLIPVNHPYLKESLEHKF